MILQLRQRHRSVFAVFSLFLPLALVIGVMARKAVPEPEALPPELLSQTQTFTATEYEHNDLFEKTGVKARLWRDLATGQFAVGFVAPKDFLKPDLIVYWLAGRPNVSDELPTDATLLGSFVAAVLPLPVEATEKEGVLILFSLADQEIVDISKPIRFAEPKR